jgi:hypothetical protein
VLSLAQQQKTLAYEATTAVSRPEDGDGPRPSGKCRFKRTTPLEMDVGETLVAVEFHDPEVVVTHELFASEAAREQHEGGWSGCLDRLPEAI